MARASWFDEQAEVPLIDEQASRLESFTRAMADGTIEARELEKQQESLIEAMKAVEGDLDDATHAKITRLLVELSAYNVMRLLHELHTERARMTFGK